MGVFQQVLLEYACDIALLSTPMTECALVHRISNL